MRPGRNVTLWDYIGTEEHFSMPSRKGEGRAENEVGILLL